MLGGSEREQQPWTTAEDDLLHRALSVPEVSKFRGSNSGLWAAVRVRMMDYFAGAWRRTAAELEERAGQIMPAGWRPLGLKLEPKYSKDWNLGELDFHTEGSSTELEMAGRERGLGAGEHLRSATSVQKVLGTTRL